MSKEIDLNKTIATEKKINDLCVECGLSYTRWNNYGKIVYSISDHNDMWIGMLSTRDAFMFLVGYKAGK